MCCRNLLHVLQQLAGPACWGVDLYLDSDASDACLPGAAVFALGTVSSFWVMM